MNSIHNTKILALNNTIGYLKKNENVFTANAAMAAEYNKLSAMLDELNGSLQKSRQKLTGKVQQKHDSKAEMVHQATMLSGIASVKFKNLGRADLAGSLTLTPGVMLHGADNDALTAAENNYKTLSENISLLEPDYVSQAMLADFKTALDNFKKDFTESGESHSTKTNLTITFKTRLKEAEEQKKNLLLMARFYLKSNPEFFGGLVENATVRDMGVRHTSVSGKVTGPDGKLLQGITIKLVNANKGAVTDEFGEYIIDNVLSGKDHIQIDADSYESVNQYIHIQQGINNQYDLQLKAKV